MRSVNKRIWLRWTKLGVAASAVVLLNTCSPLPSLIEQVKTLGELRVATRSSPLSYYLAEDGTPQGPEYDFARQFAIVFFNVCSGHRVAYGLATAQSSIGRSFFITTT